MLQVSVLGGQQITDDREGGVRVRSSRAVALVAYLAAHGGVRRTGRGSPGCCGRSRVTRRR